jgi:prophage regulatory protein
MNTQTKLRTIIRLPAVKAATGKSAASIYREMAEGTFPQSVAIGKYSRGWIEDEIAEHNRRLIAARDAGKDAHLRTIHKGIGKGRPKKSDAVAIEDRSEGEGGGDDAEADTARGC